MNHEEIIEKVLNEKFEYCRECGSQLLTLHNNSGKLIYLKCEDCGEEMEFENLEDCKKALSMQEEDFKKIQSKREDTHAINLECARKAKDEEIFKLQDKLDGAMKWKETYFEERNYFMEKSEESEKLLAEKVEKLKEEICFDRYEQNPIKRCLTQDKNNKDNFVCYNCKTADKIFGFSDGEKGE